MTEGTITAATAVAPDIVISSPDGRVLLKLNLRTGEVTGEVEDASEAGKVFVESIRHYLLPHI